MPIPQILIIVFMPFLWMLLTKRLRIESWLSPVILSYLTGIVLANFSIVFLDQTVSETFVQATVVLAIPLLLYSTDILAWFKFAKGSVLSFFLCVLSGIFASVVMAFVFKDDLENSWQVAGMLVGVYTGGTPNMNAIGVMLEAKSETLVLMNAADIFCGGIYLIFLTSVAHPLFSKVLPPFLGSKDFENADAAHKKNTLSWISFSKLIGLTVGIIAVTLASCYLIFGNLNSLAFILLMLTTLSIFASLNPKIRSWDGSYSMGEYLLLMFCVAVGMEADFSTILSEGGTVVLFTAGVLSGTIMLHLLLSRIFKIDVDTMMITSTAALYGPVFIGQIASTIKNRTLIVSGMATGLVGYAIGNYLGVLVGEILRGILE